MPLGSLASPAHWWPRIGKISRAEGDGAEEVADGRGAFLVAYLDGQPVGCGAVRRIEGEGSRRQFRHADAAIGTREPARIQPIATVPRIDDHQVAGLGVGVDGRADLGGQRLDLPRRSDRLDAVARDGDAPIPEIMVPLIGTARELALIKAEIDADAWASLNSTVSRPFETPATGKIAVKVINDYGDEVMKVFST